MIRYSTFHKFTGIVAAIFVLAVIGVAKHTQAAVPIISFSADLTVIPVNTSTNLNWDVSDAVSCTASGSWGGNQPLSGTYDTGNLLSDATYVLTCVGDFGETNSSQVTITVADPPELTFFADNTTIPYNTSTDLNWSSTNADSCIASGAWSGDVGVFGTYNTGNLISSKTYTLQCAGPGGTAMKSVQITIESPTLPPELDFSADNYFIEYNESVTLQWSSTNTDACVASGSWSGAKPLSGTQGSGNLQSDKNYVLTCTGEGGSITRFVAIVVAPQVTDPPELTFTADDQDIDYGTSTTLNWTSINAHTCTASGSWSGNRPLSGTYDTGALYATKAYTLTCVGDGGSVSQKITINVGENPFPSPTLSFTADNNAIPYDSSTNLNWSVANATSCTASKAWSGAKSLTGSENTGNLTSDKIYRLTCTGPGGSATKDVAVIVGDPTVPPSVSFWADDYSVNYNSGTVVRWTSDDANWCQLSYGASTENVALDGSYATGNLFDNTIYSLSCGNASGTTTRTLTITVNMVGPAPTINLWADENPIDYGSSTTVRWTTANADECQMSGVGDVSVNGSIGTGTLYSPKTYTLYCVGPGGEDEDSLTINIREDTIPSDPPDLLFWADSYLLLEGENTDLHWIASNADWCQASLGWSGSKPTSGDQNTGSLYTTTSYKLKCGNIRGSVSKTLTIEIGNLPDVQLDFWADEYSVPNNGNTTLRWNSANANYCRTLGGEWGWNNPKPLNGTENTGPLSNYANLYVLQCVNWLSSETKSVTIFAGDPPPSVSFYAASYTIGYNTPATLFWNAFNSTYCEAWSNNPEELTWNENNMVVSGSQQTTNLRSNTRFYIRCYGPGGTITKRLTVRVASPNAQVPTISFWADDYIVPENGSTVVHWTSQNADGCKAISTPDVVGWSGNKTTSGNNNVGPFIQNSELQLICWNGSASSSAILNIQVGEGTIARPSLSFWADAYSLAAGDSTWLRWSVLNANGGTCVASGDWSGNKSTGTGSENTGPIAVPKHYILTCSNEAGEVSSFVDINVGGPAAPPTLTFLADDYDIEDGQEVMLTWTSTNAANCFATNDPSGQWSGSVMLNGNKNVTPHFTTTYALTCIGDGGSITVNVRVSVAKVIVCPSDVQLKKGRIRQLEAWYKEDADINFSCENLAGAMNVTSKTVPFPTSWSTSDSSLVSLQGTPGLIKAEDYTMGTVNVCAEYKEIKGCAGVQVVLTCWQCETDGSCSPVPVPHDTCPEPYFSDKASCLRVCGLKWGSWREVTP
ncbi:MAG: hypothetical protein U9M90_04485 [Patescibacteria group bacterium]|nr:hypothetical protein [Patescibacteria group bacterium]